MSTRESIHERSYRMLVHLYPRRFHREYGALLVQVFRDDLDARGPRRAWARVVPDIVRSVPVQHVEATVIQPSPSRAAQLALAAAALVVLAAVAGGRYVIVAVPLAAIAAGSGLAYWRSRLPYREAVVDASARWWRVLAAGVAVLAGIALVAEKGPDVDWFPWHLAVLLYLAGWALVVAGVLLGAMRLVRRGRSQAAAI